MGGRGGTSGISRGSTLKKQIGDAETPFKATKIEGSEKQVKWAGQIRSEIGRNLIAELQQKYGDIAGTITSNDKAEEYLKDYNQAIKSFNETIRKQKNDDAISMIKAAREDYRKIKKVLGNTSAKFWIDNRTNSTINYMNQKIKKDIFG